MPTFRPGNALFVHFLQGGGATFWQAKNGGFWGPRARRAAPEGNAISRHLTRFPTPRRNALRHFYYVEASHLLSNALITINALTKYLRSAAYCAKARNVRTLPTTPNAQSPALPDSDT
jgi:hypothetical protein